MSRSKTPRAQLIVRSAVVVLLLLIVWAALARVDEITKGDAGVISSKQLQLVQSFDGGVVSEILVKEGQVVEKDQLLLKIDETRATSGVRESAAQGFALRARLARLRALVEGTSFQPPPPGGSADERRIVDEELRLFETRVSELNTLLAINQRQLQQRQQELGEMRSRKASAERSLDFGQQELPKTKPLLASGAVSEVDILRLDREVSKARGDVEQSASQIARVQASIGEAQRKIQETELIFRNDARLDMADVTGKRNALNQGAVALNDKVDKSQIKSPVRGRVQRLLANTVGGVVQPGKDIVEIVPLNDMLVIEAKVLPKDIAFIAPGQAATVKFTAYDFSIYGGVAAQHRRHRARSVGRPRPHGTEEHDRCGGDHHHAAAADRAAREGRWQHCRHGHSAHADRPHRPEVPAAGRLQRQRHGRRLRLHGDRRGPQRNRQRRHCGAPVNDAPVAQADSATLLEDTPARGNVLTDGSDVDSPALIVTQFQIGGSTFAAGSSAVLAGVGALAVNADAATPSRPP